MDKPQVGGICAVGSMLAYFAFCTQVARGSSGNDTVALVSLILSLVLLGAAVVVDSKKWLWLLAAYPIVLVVVAIANFHLEF